MKLLPIVLTLFLFSQTRAQKTQMNLFQLSGSVSSGNQTPVQYKRSMAKHKLDSTVTYIDDLRTKEYYAAHKQLFSYNSSGRQSKEESYSYDKGNKVWIDFSKVTYHHKYDSLLDFEIGEVYSQNDKKWYNQYKLEYIYNTKVALVKQRRYTWSGSTWKPQHITDITYDKKGRRIKTLNFSLVGTDTLFNSKSRLVFNAKDQLESNTLGYYDFSREWKRVKRFHQEDSLGRKTRIIELQNNGSSWDTVSKEFTYFDSSRIAFNVKYDKRSGVWMRTVNDKITLDAKGNPIEINKLDWNLERTTYMRYDKDRKYVDALFPYSNSTGQGNPVINGTLFANSLKLSHEKISETEKDMFYKEKVDFYFSDISVSVAKRPIAPKLSLYPNPTRGEVNIRTEMKGIYSLYSGEGLQILSADFDGAFQIDLSTQPKGIYLIRIYDSNQMITRKVIKD